MTPARPAAVLLTLLLALPAAAQSSGPIAVLLNGGSQVFHYNSGQSITHEHQQHDQHHQHLRRSGRIQQHREDVL